MDDAEIVARGAENLMFWDLTSHDGVVVRAWSNQAKVQSPPDALPVIAAAGLGTPPESWPLLIAQPERYKVMGTYYRGTSGAPRPHGPAPTVHDHVADLLALMDSEGVDRALFVGWSMGVNISCELAIEHPDRVAGILGVAGVPGDTFSALLGPLPIPRPWRRPIGTVAATLASKAGPVINQITGRISPSAATWVVSHTGMVMPGVSRPFMDAIFKEFLAHDFGWYFRLATGSGLHDRLDLAAIKHPVTLIGGRWDVLTAAHHIAECAAAMPDCRYELLPASHFLVAEFAPECERALNDLAVRVGLAPAA